MEQLAYKAAEAAVIGFGFVVGAMAAAVAAQIGVSMCAQIAHNKQY